MARVSDLASALSQKPIVLIVEDRITKEYLYAVWGADQQYFQILTGGSHSIVTASVEDFRKHGIANVFGLIDRDFGKDNVARWSDPNDPPCIYRPRFHELENILLDWDALAGCDLNQRRRNPSTAADIQDWAEHEAQKQPWWLACRTCLTEFQQLHSDGFPKVPKMPKVTSFQSAFDHIAQSAWFLNLQACTNRILNVNDLETQINAAEKQHRCDLASGDWMHTFSGKEIFNHILSRIHSVPKSPTAEPDVDLAKSVGKWQLAQGAIPSDVDDLRRALKARVGII